MSGEMTLFKGNLPDYLKNRSLSATTRALMGTSQNKRISIRGGVFRMMVGGQETAKSDERTMQVVIVTAAEHVSRTFYAGQYEEGEQVPPACWSADGVRPDASIKEPQCQTCANCPQNVAGSGQGDSRACRFSRRLAVVLANDMNGDVFQLVLPSKSIFGKVENSKMPLEAYVKYLAAHGVNVEDVVTEMRFDTDSATPKLTFSPVRPLEENEHNICSLKAQTQEAKNAITMNVAQTDGVVEKRLSVSRPVAKAEPAEAVEEPTKRPTKKQEEVPAKDAAALVDEWDD
jgi:hypothetical protein